MNPKYTKPIKLKEMLLVRGYHPGLSEQIVQYLNTDYTAGQMLGYLEHMTKLSETQCGERMSNIKLPSETQLVDEMLAILERRKAYVGRQMAKNAKKDPEELYIRSFDIDWDSEIADEYVYNIASVRNIDKFSFENNITFFVGENGSGKSTLLEALAVASGLNPEGGTKNYRFSTYDDHSSLSTIVKLTKGTAIPKWSYFFRAESFYNVATVALTEYNDDEKRPMTDYHARSHGESFLEFITSMKEVGLYFLDEPEAALSPQRQLTLLIHLMKMARQGSQFIIATHSPILLGIPDADIISFDEGQISRIEYEDTESYQITKLFMENREYMIERLMKEDVENEEEE